LRIWAGVVAPYRIYSDAEGLWFWCYRALIEDLQMKEDAMETNLPEGAPPSKPGPGSTQNLSSTTTTTSTGSTENLTQDFQSVQEQMKQLFRQAADAGTVPESVLSAMQTLTAKMSTMAVGLAANASAAGQLSSNAAVSSKPAVTSNALTANAATDTGQSANFYSQLQGIPIDYLVVTPLISAARGNIALATVMTEFINAIGFNAEGGTNVLQFILDQPYQVPNASQPSYLTQTVTVTAPLLSLVPIPALLVQNVTVDLTVNIQNVVQQANTAQSGSTSSGTASVGGSYWFASASFTGSYTNTNSNTTTSSQTASQAATYGINVVAEQQGPTAGMLALSQIFANCIVPVSNGSGGGG
jgi:hypothetical protein